MRRIIVFTLLQTYVSCVFMVSIQSIQTLNLRLLLSYYDQFPLARKNSSGRCRGLAHVRRRVNNTYLEMSFCSSTHVFISTLHRVSFVLIVKISSTATFPNQQNCRKENVEERIFDYIRLHFY